MHAERPKAATDSGDNFPHLLPTPSKSLKATVPSGTVPAMRRYRGAARCSSGLAVGTQPALYLGALFVVTLADDAQVGHSLQREVGEVARYRGGIEWV